MTLLSKLDASKFWSRVRKTRSCWLWNGNLNHDGYGFFWNPLSKQPIYAHRYSVFLSGRTLQPHLQVDHICRNRKCVNPKHLRQVTCQINSIENSDSLPAKNKRKKKCLRGHALVEANLYIYTKPTKDGSGVRIHRYCLKCKKIHQARRKQKMKELYG